MRHRRRRRAPCVGPGTCTQTSMLHRRANWRNRCAPALSPEHGTSVQRQHPVLGATASASDRRGLVGEGRLATTADRTRTQPGADRKQEARRYCVRRPTRDSRATAWIKTGTSSNPGANSRHLPYMPITTNTAQRRAQLPMSAHPIMASMASKVVAGRHRWSCVARPTARPKGRIGTVYRPVVPL